MSETTMQRREFGAYSPPVCDQPATLDLSRNECRRPSEYIAAAIANVDPSAYPSQSLLEQRLAERFDIEPSQALVTAGADDGIDRVIRSAVSSNRRAIVTHTPSFEMIPVFAARAEANVQSVTWMGGAFPTDEMCSLIGADAAIVVLTSPNNPTGASIPLGAMLTVIERAAECDTPVLVDLAYVEFADGDPTEVLLRRENTLIARTFSKARGLAGLRVGYILGDTVRIADARSRGLPYSVSSLSLAAAVESLDGGAKETSRIVQSVRASRETITSTLKELGARALPSDGNFVLAQFGDRDWVRDGLAGLGIRVRAFDRDESLRDMLRITCPPGNDDCTMVCSALRTALQPEALLFDLDGVLADVSQSYRQAIIRTARAFRVEASPDDVSQLKRSGGFNNDWDLTHQLVSRAGVECGFDAVRDCFERIYQGEGQARGLKESESLLTSRDLLESLRDRLPLAIVTGRPRSDALEFLSRFTIEDCFDAIVTMEDAPAKPRPDSVRLALDRLQRERAWMIGDTVDDVRAAQGAGVIPIGICAPGDEDPRTLDALLRAGASRVIARLEDLEELLP